MACGSFTVEEPQGSGSSRERVVIGLGTVALGVSGYLAARRKGR